MISYISALPRNAKRAIVVTNDFLLLVLALWLGFSIRLAEFYVPPNPQFALVLLGAPILGIITFHFMGVYKFVIRYLSFQNAVQLYMATSISALIWSAMVFLAQVPGVLPRSTFVIYWVLSATLIWFSRLFARWILTGAYKVTSGDQKALKVIIYGAGKTGIQLAQNLKTGAHYRVVGFVDDNKSLWRRSVSGIRVYSPDKLGQLIDDHEIDEILLAMPAISRKRRREILAKIEAYSVSVKIVPAIEDIVSGRIRIDDIRPVTAIDLLGRDPVAPDMEGMRKCIENNSIMVTGSGGSIGSELARQILQNRPSKLVLLELSEVALYEIEQEIHQLESEWKQRCLKDGGEYHSVDIVPVLGSVGDRKAMMDVIGSHKPIIIYHAAAYKHVPLVEHNPVAGLINNTFGTAEIAKVAMEMGVHKFVLISTDKAVRPTNVMGASKRLAEMILQCLNDESNGKTIFTMVRFGNVLDSSGSVVRKFRNQIKAGGPVTVTHKNVTRFFMSGSEAAQLVIQAGVMSQGGEVFLLDMGEPVMIDNLARSMISLMGRTVLDEDNPNGDIKIEYTGLRPGEKLYEELLINNNPLPTNNPKIMKSREGHPSQTELNTILETLKTAMASNNFDEIVLALTKGVEGYSNTGG